MANHSDATILAVELCDYCKLPLCMHSNCINVGECSHADATLCRCYVLYSPDFDGYEYDQAGSNMARDRGRRGGLGSSRKRKEGAA
jgi:hypothetical protein